ncbi:MAG: hypothetical protein QXK48_00390 [Candidatus Aenigmatarchaeota archaeon]
MQFIFSELIERFHELLGTPKDLILETFNRPDATDFVLNKCISIKNFGNFYLLIIFEMDDQLVRFSNAYRIYPQLLNGFDISKMKPVEILEEFMKKFGILKLIPAYGECKFLIDKKNKIFFPGILDIEKYLQALKNL